MWQAYSVLYSVPVRGCPAGSPKIAIQFTAVPGLIWPTQSAWRSPQCYGLQNPNRYVRHYAVPGRKRRAVCCKSSRLKCGSVNAECFPGDPPEAYETPAAGQPSWGCHAFSAVMRLKKPRRLTDGIIGAWEEWALRTSRLRGRDPGPHNAKDFNQMDRTPTGGGKSRASANKNAGGFFETFGVMLLCCLC